MSVPVYAELDDYGLEVTCKSFHFKNASDVLAIPDLKIEIQKKRKWITNGLRILTSKSVNIRPRFKGKFRATVSFTEDDGSECVLPAKVRQNGDWKDHIVFENNELIQSLDVRLLEGNIRGMVKFKLLMPHTRKGENEVIFTNIIREAGFLSPRTQLVNIKINGVERSMIFQEKATKELLEFHVQREAPILQGDERFIWGARMLSRNSFDDSLTFARLTNDNWSEKGITSSLIAQSSLARLNIGYLEYQVLVNVRGLGNSNTYLSNELLSNNNPVQKDSLDAYDSILAAANGRHALRPHNRRFYYDPMYQYFRPIYYDGNINFGKLTRFDNLENSVISGSKYALLKINQIDVEDLFKKIVDSGVKTDKKRIVSILGAMSKNLENLSKLKPKPGYGERSTTYKEYFKFLGNKFDHVKLGVGVDQSKIGICDFDFSKCVKKSVEPMLLSKILSGTTTEDEDPVLFVGTKSFQSNSQLEKTTLMKLNDSTFIEHSKGMLVDANLESREIVFEQVNPAGWASFYGGEIHNYKISFSGISGDQLDQAGAQRFNSRLLTGCVTFIDVDVRYLNIEGKGGACEDTFNFLRSTGTVSYLASENASADALDVDFSRLRFEKIEIAAAGNDCIDISGGVVEVSEILIRGCGDKGISVGESGYLQIDNADIDSVNIGIASKDSSEVKAVKATFSRAPVCVAAYRKKQEFSGALVSIGEQDCPVGVSITDQGSYSVVF